MIVLNDYEDNELLQHTSVGQESTFGSAAQAGMVDTLVRSPLGSIFRAINLSSEKMFPTGRHYTADEFKNSEHYRPGLNFPNGVRESVAKLVAERKDSEMERAQILSRAPKGFLNKAGLFGLNLTAAMLDPINVASAFVPVVSQARFAQMSAKVGVTGARTSKGLAEGFVGASLVEPIVLGAAIQEQADYGMNESLMNIGFGSVFGGGIHAIGGKVADIMRGYTPASRTKIAQGAVADMVQGKTVRADIRARMAETGHTDPVLNSLLDVETRVNALEDVRALFKNDDASLSDIEVFDRLSDIFVKKDAELTPTEREILNKFDSNKELDKLRRVLAKKKEELTEADKSVLNTYRKNTPEKRQEIQQEANKLDESIAKAKSEKTKTKQEKQQKSAKVKKLEQRKERLTNEIKDLEDLEVQYKTLPKYDSEDAYLRDVEDYHSPKSDSQYDVKAKENLETIASKETEIDTELRDIDEQIQTLKDAGFITKDELKQLEDAAKDIENAEKARGLTETLALCATRAA